MSNAKTIPITIFLAVVVVVVVGRMMKMPTTKMKGVMTMAIHPMIIMIIIMLMTTMTTRTSYLEIYLPIFNPTDDYICRIHVTVR